MDEAVAGVVRAHLAEGCEDCLGDVFSRPVGAPRPDPAGSRPPPEETATDHRPAALALVMMGVTLAVAGFTAYSILSSRPGEATPLVERGDLAGRLAALESMQTALTRRLESLSPALSGAAADVVRQVTAARAQAAESARMRRELSAAEARIAKLSEIMRRRHADLAREVGAFRGRLARAQIRLPLAAGSARPSGCTGLPDKAARVCRTFCDSRDCTNHPGPECDRLRSQFAKLTSGGSPPCGLTVAEDLSPCDRDHVDLWTFQARRDQEYRISVDTADAATAADFCVVGVCDGGDTFFGDDQFPCTSSPRDFQCPRATFVASGDQKCTAAVALCSGTCQDPATARYRLTVDPADALTLAADDALDAGTDASRAARR